jgi:hypothetical protein
VSTTTQTFNGAKTFDDGFSAGAGETITYTGVYEASHTFTDGGTWSKSGLVSARRFGDMVFLSIRALGSGASASSTDIATAANLSSGSGMRPSGTRAFHTVFYDNGAYIDGVVQINASGQIKFLKGLSGGSNAWTASGTKGIIRDQMLIYSIN